MFETIYKIKASDILACSELASLIRDPIPYYYQQKFLLSISNKNCSYNNITNDLIRNFKQYFLFNNLEEFNHEDNLWRSKLFTSPNLKYFLSATFIGNKDFSLYQQFQQIIYFQLRVLKILNLGNSFSFDINTHISLNSQFFKHLEHNYFSNNDSLFKNSKSLSDRMSSSISNIIQHFFTPPFNNKNLSNSSVSIKKSDGLRKLKNFDDFNKFSAILNKDFPKVFYSDNFGDDIEPFKLGADRYIKDYVDYFIQHFSSKDISDFDKTLKTLKDLSYTESFEEIFFDMITMIPSESYILDLNSYLLTVMEPSIEQQEFFQLMSSIFHNRLSFTLKNDRNTLNINSPFYDTMNDIYGPLNDEDLLTKIHQCTQHSIKILSDNKFEKLCNLPQLMHEQSLISILEEMSHGKINNVVKKRKI